MTEILAVAQIIGYGIASVFCLFWLNQRWSGKNDAVFLLAKSHGHYSSKGFRSKQSSGLLFVKHSMLHFKFYLIFCLRCFINKSALQFMDRRPLLQYRNSYAAGLSGSSTYYGEKSKVEPCSNRPTTNEIPLKIYVNL